MSPVKPQKRVNMAFPRVALALAALAVCWPALLALFGRLGIFISPTVSVQGQAPGTPLSFRDVLAQSQNHTYKTEILSRDPLMVYLDGFLHPDEAAYLLNIRQAAFSDDTRFARSRVQGEDSFVESSTRTSISCYLSDDDPIVSSVKQRAASFLGFVQHDGIEDLQLVRYISQQNYALHYDWFTTPVPDKAGKRYNRLASFFIYLEADCTKGETYFPHVPLPEVGKRRTDYFTNPMDGNGIGFTPRLGGGVFWMNMREDGSLDQKVLHAGLPVERGRKTGMNIWVKRFVDPEMKGPSGN